MKIGGMIVGNRQGGIVTDGRTLNAMEKAGHFIRPDPTATSPMSMRNIGPVASLGTIATIVSNTSTGASSPSLSKSRNR